MTANRVYIIGIGYKPLDERSRAILRAADVLLASDRLLEVFEKYAEFPEMKEKLKVIEKIEETLDFIVSNWKEKKIVLLGSGDPMFYGIGSKVATLVGRESVEIIPDLSSMQVAFSRIKEKWDDAYLMTLHGGLIPGRGKKSYTLQDVPALFAEHRKIAILTDGKNNPAAIAATFLSLPVRPPVKIFVCEKLGYGMEEKITEGTPEEIARGTYSDPNVVILLSDEPAPAAGFSTRFGLTENEIFHSRGLITKDEVRAVTLHRLRLPDKGIAWDIGAGSGSLSVEAARMCPGMRVYAVEKDGEQVSHMESNRAKFNVFNMEIVRGEAPEALAKLPDPDRVWIGGSGGRLSELIDVVKSRMPRGVVVINAATLETMNETVNLLEAGGFKVEISQVSIARAKELGGKRHLTALNPVFVISGEKA